MNKRNINDYFFDNFFDNIKFYSNEEKEVYISIYNYYKILINNEDFKNIFKEISIIFENENFLNNKDLKIFKKNDKFLLYYYHFYDKNLDFISFFYSSVIYHSFMDNGIINNKYEKSDILLYNSMRILKNFFIFFEKEKDIWSENFENDLLSHIFPLFEYLSLVKIISSKLIFKKDINFIKTEKFWKLNNYVNIENYDFDIIFVEPKIIKFKKNFYSIGGYYNKIYEIFKKNPNSGYGFELRDKQYLLKLVKLKWFVDIDWFDFILKEIEEFEGLNLYNIYIKLDDVINKLNESEWNNDIIQKEYSKLIMYKNIFDYYKFLKKIEIKEEIYFPVFFDFRGRLYYYSRVCITYNKILRTLYYYGYYDNMGDTCNVKLKSIINENMEKIEKIKIKFNINIKNDKLDINILLIVISIGKLLIKKDKEKINMNDYINEALIYFDNEILMKKLEDDIEIKHYIKILKNINNRKKYVIFKDFTASFFQHLTRLLGPKSIDTLKLANMYDKYNWYDPYTHILNKFLFDIKISNTDKFTRKSIKKTVMTIPYSIGFDSAWKYFKEEINIDNCKDLSQLKKEYRLFFNFTKKILETDHFFKNSTEKMILNALTKLGLYNKININFEYSCVNLIYYNKKVKRIDLILRFNEEIRITKKINQLDLESIDYQSIIQSIRANWIAVLDAYFLIRINKKNLNILYSIHDSVLIDWFNNDELIMICNEEMNINNFDVSWDNEYSKDNFSIFIIL